MGSDDAVDWRRCDWRAIGAPTPHLATPATPAAFWVTRPVYDTTATAYLILTRPAPAGPEGRGFFEAISCAFARTGGAWTEGQWQMAGIS